MKKLIAVVSAVALVAAVVTALGVAATSDAGPATATPTAKKKPKLPTPAREPAITTGRVDMVIATFTYTRDRDTRIDFSRAYYKATGRLLVKNDQPNALIEQLSSRNIVTTRGSRSSRAGPTRSCGTTPSSSGSRPRTAM